MFPILAAAGLVSGGISAIQGLSQKHRANQLIQNNPRAIQQIPDAILQNQKLAEMYAQKGMPSAQYQQQQQAINQGTAAGLNTLGDKRSAIAGVGNLVNAANNANLNLNAKDAAMLRQNQQNLIRQNNITGQWQNNVWDWNQRQKYLETAAAARALMGAGNQNLNAGLDRAMGGFISQYGSKMGVGGNNQFGNLFGKKPPVNNSIGIGDYGSGTGVDDSAYTS